MRILHTSDWHLGQHFVGKSRLAEHQAFLQWLVQQVRQLNIDAIIVAGDIFDTASPPSYARELYHHFIVQLQQTGCHLVLLGGNHDSVAVLNESKSLLACLNTRVIPAISDTLSEQLIVLHNEGNQPAAILCAVPFIRARDLVQSQAGQSSQLKQQQLQQAIADYYQQLFVEAQQLNTQHGFNLPIIMTGHLTTMGVSQTESVRDIYIGTLEAFAASQFPPADYIALGHIHQAQQITSSTDIRYSGSPLALSFDEAKQQKQLWLIEFSPAGKAVSSIPVPCFQPLQSISSDLANLENKLHQSVASLLPGQQLWLEIIITQSDAYLSDLAQRVEQICQHFPVQLLRLRRQRENVSTAFNTGQQSLAELNPMQVWQARMATETLTEEQQQQLTELYQHVVAALEQGTE